MQINHKQKNKVQSHSLAVITNKKYNSSHNTECAVHPKGTKNVLHHVPTQTLTFDEDFKLQEVYQALCQNKG